MTKANNSALLELYHTANDKKSLTFLRGRVIADQVHSFGPDHPPYIHVIAHIDGTANFVGCGPNQLWKKT